MSFDFVNFNDMPDSVEAIERFATKHMCEVNERYFWEQLRQYDMPNFADSTNLYLDILYSNVKYKLVEWGADEEQILFYTNCLDSHFCVDNIEIHDYDDFEKAYKILFKVEIKVLDYTDLIDLEDGAESLISTNVFSDIEEKLEEDFFEVENIKADFKTSVDFPDEYDNDALYFIFYPEKKMSEDEVKLLKTFINKKIKPMLRKNIRASK